MEIYCLGLFLNPLFNILSVKNLCFFFKFRKLLLYLQLKSKAKDFRLLKR